MSLMKKKQNNTPNYKTEKTQLNKNERKRKAMIGNKRAKGHIVSEEARKQISKNAKKTLQKKIKEEGYYWGMTGKKHTAESIKKNRESKIARIEKAKFNGQPLEPRMGKNEKQILDNLEKDFNRKIERQFRNSGYFIDGYIPELKLAIEVDEDYHNFQKEKDERRQKEIEESLGCVFLRIEDTTSAMDDCILPG